MEKAEIIATDTEMVASDNPQSLLALAINKGVDIEQLERLMALKERYDAAQAKKDFITAMSLFQSKVPVINKSKLVAYTTKDGGRTSYKFAELADIDEAIKWPMADCGLSKAWKIDDKDGSITVTCIISHANGHSECTTMTAQKDQSGGKNDIQSRASAVTYLQRYTLVGALGLTTASEDNDAVDDLPTSKGTAQSQQQSDLPWLNQTLKGETTLTREYRDCVAHLKNGAKMEELRNSFKISKATVAALEASAALPLCADAQLQQAIARAKGGEKGLVDKMDKAFAMTNEQIDQLSKTAQ